MKANAVVMTVVLGACGTDEPAGREGDVAAPCDQFVAPVYESTDPNMTCFFDTEGLDPFLLANTPVIEGGGGVGREPDGTYRSSAFVWSEDLGQEGVAINVGDLGTECVWRRCNSTTTP